MTATAERACARLAASGGQAELVTEMLTATFDVICDVALSGREHFDAATFSAAITQYFRTAGRASLLDFLGFPPWFPRPGELMAARSVHVMHEMVATAIEARRKQTGSQDDDLLNHMLAAQDPETGQRMSPEELIHNMQFFIVAGHETTALALSWALYLLAHSPDWQDQLRAQVSDRLGGRAAEPDDLKAMPLVEQVLEESMRLYPPVGLLARTVLQADELCGRQMKPNDIVFLPIWALHRHDLWWERPALFDPGRFAPQNRSRLNKYQYLPFGAGPRVCVGADFAMMQACIILASLVQRFRFLPGAPGPRPVMMMTVRPEPGIFLEVQPATDTVG
jgi:cytochrome P450